MTYAQVDLRRGRERRTAWIPTSFAKKGKYLRIGSENGWLVERAYTDSQLDEDLLLLYRDQYRTQRQASDI